MHKKKNNLALAERWPWSPFYIWPESTGTQIPLGGESSVCTYERLYMLAGVCRRLKGWEIMSTKGAPGALDWVSLLPFLPLSLFHPPLLFSSGHFQRCPGTFKRLDRSFL